MVMKKILLTLMFGLLLCGGNAFAEGRIISDKTKDGLREVRYLPDERVCPSEMLIYIKDGKVDYYKSIGGCSGNSTGIGALVSGMSIDEAIKRLEGIPCGKRPTSCPDQLAQALKAIKKRDAGK